MVGEYYSKLEVAVKFGCSLEPRVITMVLTSVTDKVIQEDAILRRAWLDKTIQHSLRNPHSIWEVLPFAKIMAGE
eukprot:6627534-Prorocentrum_lima.AAC.1